MLTLREAAEKIGVAPKTVRQWIRRGKLAAERVIGHFGPEYRIAEAEVERLRENRGAVAVIRGRGDTHPQDVARLVVEIAGLRAEVSRLAQAMEAVPETPQPLVAPQPPLSVWEKLQARKALGLPPP